MEVFSTNKKDRRFQQMKLLSSALVLLMLLLVASAFNVSAQLSINSLTVTNVILCNGDLTGEITVIADNISGTVSYSLDNIDFSNTTGVFSGLAADDYIVYVKDDNETVNGPINVPEPPLLEITVTGTFYECDGDGTGELIVTPSGGTANYDIDVSGGVDNDDLLVLNATYSDLSAASYIISVTDANECVATPVIQDIINDVNNPTLSAMPYNYFMPFATFDARPLQLDSIDFSFSAYTCDNGDAVHDTMTYTVNGRNYQDLELQLTARQASTTWANADYLEIKIDYGSGYTQVTIDKSEFKGANALPDAVGEGSVSVTQESRNTGWLPIHSADGNATIKVQVISHTTVVGRIYNIDNLLVRGNLIHNVIPKTVSGAPDCNDLNECTAEFVDGNVNWICSTPGSQEFYFIRTWTAVDLCDKPSAPQDQIISVGARPYFNATPRDTVFDFCWNSPTIPCTSVGDACGTVAVSWIITDLTDTDTLASGITATVSGYTFTLPVLMADTTFKITWTLTDQAYITETAIQEVSIKPSMVVTCTPAKMDFCSQEEVSFTISVQGGTGSYNALDPGTSITPNGTWNNGAGLYTTSLLDLGGTTNIVVEFTDVTTTEAVGGCPSGSFTFYGTGAGADFNIHNLITTPGISRD